MVATKSHRGTKPRGRRRVTAIPDKLTKASNDRIPEDDVAISSIRKTMATLNSPLRPKTKLGRQTQRRCELIRKLAEAERAYTQFQFDTAMANSSDNPKRMTGDARFPIRCPTVPCGFDARHGFLTVDLVPLLDFVVDEFANRGGEIVL